MIGTDTEANRIRSQLTILDILLLLRFLALQNYVAAPILLKKNGKKKRMTTQILRNVKYGAFISFPMWGGKKKDHLKSPLHSALKY